MADLLLELFSEEIPARLQRRAAEDLKRMVQERLFAAGLTPDGAAAFATPRRLTLVVSGLAGRSPDRSEEKKGPRVGAPEKAVEGFLKSAGLSSLDQCETREDKKGAYYVAVVKTPGRETASLIAGIVPEVVRAFPWPKAMRWGAGDLRWVRPLHSILCTFEGEVVDFEIDGVRSGDRTFGHRFLAPGEIQVRSFEPYAEKLKAAKVVLDAEERAEHIHGEAKSLCATQGLELVEDKGLLAEVAGLVEWPVVLMGAFDEKFLQLPDEVLTASMRGHQKYFSVRDPKTGRLANRFVFVANIEAPDGGAAMRVGYERVLTARLSDGLYLYRQDLARKLETRVADLDRVTFFEGLGSVGDKARRIAALAREIAPAIGADPELAERAGLLAKADLTTGMVYEFPELQGIMGRYYAIQQKEHPAVADAIRDHYKPAGQDDAVPSAPVSAAAALADKLDTLTAFWAIDQKPTGSKDPFALRRAALGVIQLALTNDLRIRLNASFPDPLSDTRAADLLAFFHDRLKVYLRDHGHRHDHVDAVLRDADGNPLDDLVLIVRRLEALEAFVKSGEGENLLSAYKRASNILKAEEKRDAAPADRGVDPALFAQAEEKALDAALAGAETAAADAVQAEDFAAAMVALAHLRAPLDAFFEAVTVNVTDGDKAAMLRRNRLALLARVRAACGRVADLSKIKG